MTLVKSRIEVYIPERCIYPASEFIPAEKVIWLGEGDQGIVYRRPGYQILTPRPVREILIVDVWREVIAAEIPGVG